MWETVAERIISNGGNLLFGRKVDEVSIRGGLVRGVGYSDGDVRGFQACDVLLSTMPIKDLVLASREAWPSQVFEAASKLQYRDFITVGLLYRDVDLPRALEDNWIYIQEPGVQVGRVQVFNNWSPWMVADPATVWLGLEFFCNEADPLWSMSDESLKALARREMMQVGLVSASSSLDAVVIRVPKAYPGYFGDAYGRFDQIRAGLDSVRNLFVIGRNGMHRYNNQDHSMLTAKEAAAQIVSGKVDKGRIWAINVGDEYHEEKP
jgi:protoporphyrinogen oxidase